MFRFPWGDMHSLNLGWFLQKFNELREDWATAEAGIDGALDAEIQRAEDALSDVFDARDAAAASATAAAGSASSAGTSATAAQNSATGAANSATLANNKATAAGLSEAAAAQSATQAGNSATAAAGSATTASNAATNAAASETAAGQSATAAAASAASIEGDVDAAAASASAAAASEAAAAQSAADAAASAASSAGTSAQRMIAPVEETATASKPYTTGERFIYNGTLYEAIAAIEKNDTITPNVNCLKITVDQELSNLETNLEKTINALGIDYFKVSGKAATTTQGYEQLKLLDNVPARKNITYRAYLTIKEPINIPIYFYVKRSTDDVQLTTGAIPTGDTVSNMPTFTPSSNYNFYFYMSSGAPAGIEVTAHIEIIDDITIINSIAPVFADMVAETALAANQFIIVGRYLYKTTTTIANGANLIEGTNVRRTTIAAELTNLIN